MANRIVVVGGSAGAVEALSQIVSSLPASFAAPIIVVVHIPPMFPSSLPDILSRKGPLRAVHPRAVEPLQNGMIYVAPPDRHIVVRGSELHLGRGPRENGHRPAVDPLFRTAAECYGANTIAVLLSGNLSDGTAGIIDVEKAGGTIIVQDPRDALYAGMPESALAIAGPSVRVALCVEIGPLIQELVRSPGEETAVNSGERDIAEGGRGPTDPDPRENGRPVPYSCPDCGGTLWAEENGDLVKYRCRVGHAYTSETLLEGQGNALEAALWAALRALQEVESHSLSVANRMSSRGHKLSGARLRKQAEDAAERAAIIRTALERRNGVDDLAAGAAEPYDDEIEGPQPGSRGRQYSTGERGAE